MFVYYPPYSLYAVSVEGTVVTWFGYLVDQPHTTLERWVGDPKKMLTRIPLIEWTEKLKRHFPTRPSELTYWQDSPPFVLQWVKDLPEYPLEPIAPDNSIHIDFERVIDIKDL